MGSLKDNKDLVENYIKTNRTLGTKISTARETLAKEKSAQHLMNFELSKLTYAINGIKHDLSEMETEYKRLVSVSQELSPELKRIRNYFLQINPMQTDRKAEWMQNLNNQLNTLDFNAEVRNVDPDYKGNSSTQHF